MPSNPHREKLMRATMLFVLIVGLIALTATTAFAIKKIPPPSPTAQARAKAKKFLDQYQADYARLQQACSLADWEASCSSTDENYVKKAECELAFCQYHSNTEAYRIVCDLLRDKEYYDPLTTRALVVAKLAYEANQLPADLLKQMVEKSNEIEKLTNNFRAKIDGQEYTNNQLLELLAKENDSAKRQQYWEALKQVGAVTAPKIIELAKIRNQAARRLGYSDYWDMQIRLQEYDPQQLLAIFAELETMTKEPFKQMKGRLDAELAQRFNTTPDKLMPWHYDNPFFQTSPPSDKVDVDEFYKDKTKEQIVDIAKRFYAGIGLPIDNILKRSDLFERPSKDQHAFCTNIDHHGDVRLLCNVKPTAEWMDTMLHESGHGVYDYYMNFSLPYNLREPAHIFSTEGIAMLFGALAKTPEWIVANTGSDPDQVAAMTKAIREQRRREQLIFARWTLVMLHFEKALYENPDQDLNTLWWDHVERYQALVRPASRSKPDWAAKPHFTCAPVYYHNYMLGELFAAQLRHWLSATEQQAGRPMSNDYTDQSYVGRMLQEKVFMPGARWPWNEFVRNVTGEELTAKYFVEETKE